MQNVSPLIQNAPADNPDIGPQTPADQFFDARLIVDLYAVLKQNHGIIVVARSGLNLAPERRAGCQMGELPGR